MSTNITDLICCDEAECAEKILDYYDGEQEEWLVKILNDPTKGRKDWKGRGIIPRTRNIMKMIIDKSGLLFNDKAPKLDVYTSAGEVDENASIILQQELENVDWVEFFTNFDSVVRMLKTALVLVQYDIESQSLVLDILHRQNCAVVLNPNNKQINTLVYKVNDDGFYRVFTKDLIQDVFVSEDTGEETILSSEPNTFGIVPVAVFHDTNTPRCDFWNEIPMDLLQINDIYNLHITDSEYAASWSKLKTLFTNCRILGAEDIQQEAIQMYGQALPRMAPSGSGLVGGPSQVIQIDTMGVDSPFVEYKGPEVNLEPIDLMIQRWVGDYAADWSVNVQANTSGGIDSGFKLMVEEMPNMELRKKRARMFEAGFKRLFKVIKTVINTARPGTFADDLELFVSFSAPDLVIDEKANEEVWSRKISEGRASRVDYFMEVKGMTKDEAQAKVNEIDAERLASPAMLPRVVKQSAPAAPMNQDMMAQ